MKKHHQLLTGVIACLIGVIAMCSLAFADTTASTPDFVHSASIANQFEIESSKMALDKSQNKEVKRFAQHMIDDHTKTGNELKSILKASKSVTKMPTELDDPHQKLLDQLHDATGADFDRQYVSIQTDAHKEAVDLFTDYSKHGKNRSLRKFAANKLPMLHDHLKQIEKVKVAD